MNTQSPAKNEQGEISNAEKDMGMSFKKNAFVALAFVLLFVSMSFIFLDRMTSPAALRDIYVGDVLIQAGIADSDAERTLGLSGRESLPKGEGLLFVFDTPDVHAFWMKDMLFPIDMLWFDEQNKLIYIADSVSPQTYPATYTGGGPSRYVLELPAGYARERNIKIGDSLSF